MNKIEENNNENESQGNTSNSDNVNENGKRMKRTRIRPCKAERFSEDREKLILILNGLTGLDKNNKIILYDLEHNEELKKYLKENIPHIKKIFKTCLWGYFSNDIKKGMGNEIGLLKAIYKNEGWEISSKRKICEREGERKLYVELHFNKN